MKIKKACLYIRPDPLLLNNQLFAISTYGDKMKSDCYPYIELKKELSTYNFDLSTQDINSPEESEITFCIDYPQHFIDKQKKINQIWCLIISEPQIYCPESWNKKNHINFDYIYTYDNTLVDNVKYFHYTFSIDIGSYTSPINVSDTFYKKRKLCCFVSSAIQGAPDKKNKNSLLYSRYLAIKWFGKHKPNDLDFFSSNFERNNYLMSFRGLGILEKMFSKKIIKLLAKNKQRNLIKTYRGKLPALDKLTILQKYNFYLCYENIKDVDGYLTEKIFDCFYSSCVPIYWGASNVKELISFDCFINGADFKDFDSLYNYIKKLSFKEYNHYLNEANKLLNSKKLDKFKVSNFTQCILNPLKLSNESPNI